MWRQRWAANRPVRGSVAVMKGNEGDGFLQHWRDLLLKGSGRIKWWYILERRGKHWVGEKFYCSISQLSSLHLKLLLLPTQGTSPVFNSPPTHLSVSDLETWHCKRLNIACEVKGSWKNLESHRRHSAPCRNGLLLVKLDSTVASTMGKNVLPFSVLTTTSSCSLIQLGVYSMIWSTTELTKKH